MAPKADVILEAIENGASDEDLLVLEGTDEEEFDILKGTFFDPEKRDTKKLPVFLFEDLIPKPEKDPEPEQKPVAPIPFIDAPTTAEAPTIVTDPTKAIKPEPEVEKYKVRVLDFDKWHINKGGEKTMVEKLQAIHGDDYEITQEVIGDDVVGIK